MNLFKNKHLVETRRDPEIEEDRIKPGKGPCWRKQKNASKRVVGWQQSQAEMLPTCRVFLMEQNDILLLYYYYNPTERLAVDEMIVLYKGIITFLKYFAINVKGLASKLTNFATLCAWHEFVFRQTTPTCHSPNNSNRRDCAASNTKR